MLAELAQLALPDVLVGWHVTLLIRTDEDESRKVRWIHVGVREAATERETKSAPLAPLVQ